MSWRRPTTSRRLVTRNARTEPPLIILHLLTLAITGRFPAPDKLEETVRGVRRAMCGND